VPASHPLRPLPAPVPQNELVKKLRAVHAALSEDDVEPNSPNYPSLDALAAHLVSPKLINHKDKEVRLFTSLCCMEVFYLYAPEPPWDASEIIRVFEQIISQLSNLAHCHNSTQTNYAMYFHILSQLATVKIGVVLVELNRQGDSVALEQLAELTRTLLMVVHADHPQEVSWRSATCEARRAKREALYELGSLGIFGILDILDILQYVNNTH
jgi:sister-chromatid-cohesion protein PDS5